MYQLKSIIFLYFLFSLDASALVIKIDKDDSGYFKENLVGFSHNGIINKRVYRLKINDNYMKSLGVGQLQIEPQDQVFQIIFSNGQDFSVPQEIASRILKILRDGWHSVMNWQPSGNIELHFRSDTPPCSFVFYYFAYGITNFQDSPVILTISMQTESIESAVNENQILPYTIVLIANKDNFHEKNAYFYLGNNLFLSWSHSTNQFYLMSSQDIDISHHINNPHYLQVIQVNGVNNLLYQMLISVFTIWQAHQYNSKPT